MASTIRTAAADRAVFFYSRHRAVRYALVFTLFALGIAYAYPKDLSGTASILKASVLILGFLLCAAGVFLFSFLAAGNRPALIVDAEGFSIPYALRRHIRWDEVRSISDLAIGVVIKLHDYGHCRHPPKPQRTLLASALGGKADPITISFAGLDASATQVRDRIGLFLPPRLRARIDRDELGRDWSYPPLPTDATLPNARDVRPTAPRFRVADDNTVRDDTRMIVLEKRKPVFQMDYVADEYVLHWRGKDIRFEVEEREFRGPAQRLAINGFYRGSVESRLFENDDERIEAALDAVEALLTLKNAPGQRSFGTGVEILWEHRLYRPDDFAVPVTDVVTFWRPGAESPWWARE